MTQNIALCADSTCDIGPELQKRFNVHFVPYTIISEGVSHKDNVDIRPTDLFEAYWQHGSLPQTGAVNVEEYHEFFEQQLRSHDAVIHITLGGAITSSAEHAAIAAQGLENVYVIDSKTLSTATGLLVIRAGEMMAEGMPAEEIAAELERLTGCTHASFVLDTLEFLHAGGRCPSIAALVASMLKIKPCIQVDNSCGAMNVGKVYRGKLSRVVRKYVADTLDSYPDIIADHVFITHTDIAAECVEAARAVAEEKLHPKHIYDTTASCTISCHCGPGTLGVLFLTESACR